MLKKNNFNYYVIILLNCVLMFSSNLNASSREPTLDHVGNGGDDYSIEFIGTAYEVLETLLYYPIKEVSPDKFLTAIRETKVNSKSRLYKGGYEVDALNYPKLNPPKIELSRSGWDRLDQKPIRKMLLVFHEYLGIMEVADDNYQLTQKLREALFCEKFSNAQDKSKLKHCKKKEGVNVDLTLIEAVRMFEKYFSKRGIKFIHDMRSTKDVPPVKRAFSVYRKCMVAWEKHFPNCKFKDISFVRFSQSPHGYPNAFALHVNKKDRSKDAVENHVVVSGILVRVSTSAHHLNVQSCFDQITTITDLGRRYCSK